MSKASEIELTPSMLPEGICRTIAEEIGVENLLKLSKLVGGTTFYFAKKQEIIRPFRDIKIREEYNGNNLKELSRKYNLSQRRILQIVK